MEASIDHSIALCKTEGEIIDLIHDILRHKCMPRVHYVLDHTFPMPSHIVYEIMLRHEYGQKVKLALWKRYPQQVETIIIDSFLGLQGHVEPLHKQIYDASKKIIFRMNVDKYARSEDPCELRFFISHSKDFRKIISVLRTNKQVLNAVIDDKSFFVMNIVNKDCKIHDDINVDNKYLCDLVSELFDNEEFHVLDFIKFIDMGSDVKDICLEKIFEYDLPEYLTMINKHYSSIILRAYLEKKWRILLHAVECVSTDTVHSAAENLQKSTRIEFYDTIRLLSDK